MRLPYAEVEFESTGGLHDRAQLREAIDRITASQVTDVLLLAHGWNNDMPAARRLFERLTDNLADVQERVPGAAARRIVVVGVLWPSIRWADDEEHIAGGGAGLGNELEDLRQAIGQAIDDPAACERLRQLAARLETSATARQAFLDTLRTRLPAAVAGDEDPPPIALRTGDAERVFDEASGPGADLLAPDRRGGAAAVDATGGAAGGFGFGGLLRGAHNLLNLTSYYTMKDRAGKVGTRGVAALLAALGAAAPQGRYHLAGHSFGARVVSAAAVQQPAHSLTLLQGAFSHHGLASDYDGQGRDVLFRSVLTRRRLTGPLLVTHTANDKAVGLAYAIASRLARQVASGIGGPNDLYGGIGRNGALKTPEVFRPAGALLDVGGRYGFAAGSVYNLDADEFIGSHGAVTGREVAYALLSAMSADGTPF